MTTFVHTEKDFAKALYALCELDYDAVEAYEAAIQRLENEGYKARLREFKRDHENHIVALRNLLIQHSEEAPEGPSAKQWLTKGKVILANLIGDNTILSAMLSNEGDTNEAYAGMVERTDQWPDAEKILSEGLLDERRHKVWLEETLAVLV